MTRAWFVCAGGVLAIGLLAAASALASGVALTGVGSRATALGGCYRGVSDDWSATFWNPAGLTQLMGMQVGASVETIKPTATYVPKLWNGMSYSVARSGETGNDPKTFFVPSAGFVYGTGNMAFALGLNTPFGLGSKWDLLETSKYNAAYPDFEFETKLQIINVQPSFAYDLNDRLSVGLGLGVVYADILIRKPTFTPNPYFKQEFQQFRQAALAPAGGMSPDFNHLLTDSELDGDGMGFAGSAGVMLRATDELQIGLSARYYADVTLEGKVNATTYFATNAASHGAIQANLKPTLDGMLQGGLLTQAEYVVLLNYYSGGSIPKYDNLDAEATLPLPMNVGIGLGYSGIKNLLATLDVDWTRWSSWDVIDVEMSGGAKTQLVEKWDDTIRIGVGMEYALDRLKLIAAFYHEPSAVPDETITITIPDVGQRNALNVGVRYELDNIAFGLGYKYTLIGDRDVSDWKPTADQRGYNNMAGAYEMTAHNASLGVEYSF